MAKSHTLQGFAIFLFWLHTARIENPETPLTHLSGSNFHEYYSEHPQTPPIHHPDTPQTASGNTTCQQTTTDANRHNQTYSNSTFQCLAVSGGVCLHLLVSADMSCSLEQSGGCLGAVWVVSGSVLSVSHGNWRRWDVWGVSGLSVLAVWS